MRYGSMTHDFTGRKIKKKSPNGEVYQKYTPKPSELNVVTPNFRRDADVHYASVELGAPTVCGAPEKKEYTGSLVTGIATMHKSNAVPVINQEQATDIANMRRG